ncbi:MAG: Autolysis response regulater LytR [Hydrogenibacillus schlegelii]|uniref:Autolysis response regulater LytR n=1 Tax=Hydrogenibacillus schlegelii TaxID=1484 RepID=A0A2T5GBU7_HYDSH|nr:LytTR family DNA-binding domain-containing protein [Hydrogenibacillus schlegelii]PTQ53660.1 MAG: Autolysis response regulater LytR [Hydrogenibacillus schlegelii]
MKLRAIVAEDEPLAREELLEVLARDPEVVVVGEAEDGEMLFDLLSRHRPDALFLDIEMPRRSGLQALERWIARHGAEAAPLVVFTTAYERYALEAFNLEAVDYLLKPYDAARVERALRRLKARLRERSTSSAPAGKLLVDDGERYVVLDPKEILYAERKEREIVVHTLRGPIRSRMALAELEERLQGGPFLRVHRSFLLNLDYVDSIEPWANGAYTVYLKDANHPPIPVSRGAAKALFDRLGRR